MRKLKPRIKPKLYYYFISFTWQSRMQSGNGNTTFAMYRPITEPNQIQDIEANLRSSKNWTSVVIDNYIFMKEENA